MQAKYAVALILALQVSMSLCEIPTPSAELVEKYDRVKTKIYEDLKNIYAQRREQVASFVETLDSIVPRQAIKTMVEDFQAHPQYQEAIKAAATLMEEAKPRIDLARSKMLGLYETYLRPYVGDHLSNIINLNDQ